MAKAIEVPYAQKALKINLPNSWKILGQFAPIEKTPSEAPETLLHEALDNLIGIPKFKTIIHGKKNAIILSDDKSRPTPAKVIIPLLLNILNASGIPDNKIKVVVGRGLHPSLSSSELNEKFGSEVLSRIEVLDHNPDDNLSFLGVTQFGTKVYINSDVVNSDLKIGLGSIMPHELAGYTGGSGIVIPGVAGRETINLNHCLVGTFNAEFGEMKGNTIRDDMEEAAQLLGLDLIINTLLNSQNEILKVVAGDPISAHHKGVTYSKNLYSVKIPKLADVVIANSFPRESTFGKALKALFAADRSVKADGTIILLAPCLDGVSSSPIFETMLLQNPTSDLLFNSIERGELPGESCVLYLFSKVKERRIIVVTTGISQIEIEQMGLEYAPSLEAALKMIICQNPEVLILSKAAITLPILQ
ncbi:MAG: nickel-dependent lactate racemase [Candidatus Helarchaeota archaeon]